MLRGLKTQAFAAACSGDQVKPKGCATLEMDALVKQSIFSMSHCECIRHTNSWRTSAGLMGKNRIPEAKIDPA